MSLLSRGADVYEGYADAVADQKDTEPGIVSCLNKRDEFVRCGDHCGNCVDVVIWLCLSFQWTVV